MHSKVNNSFNSYLVRGGRHNSYTRVKFNFRSKLLSVLPLRREEMNFTKKKKDYIMICGLGEWRENVGN